MLIQNLVTYVSYLSDLRLNATRLRPFRLIRRRGRF